MSHIFTGLSTGQMNMTINANTSTICHKPGVRLIGHLLLEFGLFVRQVACFVKCWLSLRYARHERFCIQMLLGCSPKCGCFIRISMGHYPCEAVFATLATERADRTVTFNW